MFTNWLTIVSFDGKDLPAPDAWTKYSLWQRSTDDVVHHFELHFADPEPELNEYETQDVGMISVALETAPTIDWPTLHGQTISFKANSDDSPLGFIYYRHGMHYAPVDCSVTFGITASELRISIRGNAIDNCNDRQESFTGAGIFTVEALG